MELTYNGKKSKKEILGILPTSYFSKPISEKENILINGDNLEALRILVHNSNLKGKIDLIYITRLLQPTELLQSVRNAQAQ